MTFVINPYSFASSRLLYDAIVAAGLTTDLKVCLDALDPLSYGGSGQVFSDRSGNGHDFNLGITSGAEASDPTFNALGYFSSDGGDAFDLVGANPAWANGLHLDGAIFSWFAEFYLPAGFPRCEVFGTRNTDPGVIVIGAQGGDGKPRVVSRFSGGSALDKTADSALSTGAWHHVGGSVSENGGNVSFLWADGNYAQVGAADTFDANYSTPGGTNDHLAVGSSGSNDTTTFTDTMGSGVLFSGIAIWSGGTPLTKANIDSVRSNLGGLRF